jgi:sugar/nucleoside kinase (ribokinase family)
MLFGNSAAFLCITKMGAMASMPDRLTTDLFIEEFELQKRMKVVDCANGK